MARNIEDLVRILKSLGIDVDLDLKDTVPGNAGKAT